MPDRIVNCIPMVEDIKIGHLNLLVQLERPDHKLRKSVLLPRLLAAAAGGRVGRADNAMRRLLRKSVIFFEI